MEPNGYFSIKRESEFIYTISPITDHVLYKAHFPQYPIVPGSCIMEIVRKAVEIELNKKAQLRHISNVKFIQPLLPLQTKELKLELAFKDTSFNPVHIKANIHDEKSSYSKAELTFELYDE